jgi:energy-coupling factor transporter ATP-binding protein EcfA2
MNLAESEIPWSDLIPSALKIPYNAYKHRVLIDKLWKKLTVACGSNKADIVITGRSGVGKSVLSSRMRGIITDLSWELPSISPSVETGVTDLEKWSKIVSVIPGNNNEERVIALQNVFNTDDCLEGIIHVVDWGYTFERNSIIRGKRIHEEGFNTIEKIRNFNLTREVDDFKKICDKVRELYLKKGRPFWMVIAATKCDLYVDRIDQAQSYYSATGESAFSEALREFQSLVGSDNIQMVSVPVSSWDNSFEWNKEVVETKIGGSAESRALFRNFIRVVSEVSSKK